MPSLLSSSVIYDLWKTMATGSGTTPTTMEMSVQLTGGSTVEAASTSSVVMISTPVTSAMVTSAGWFQLSVCVVWYDYLLYATILQ